MSDYSHNPPNLPIGVNVENDKIYESAFVGGLRTVLVNDQNKAIAPYVMTLKVPPQLRDDGVTVYNVTRAISNSEAPYLQNISSNRTSKPRDVVESNLVDNANQRTITGHLETLRLSSSVTIDVDADPEE